MKKEKLKIKLGTPEHGWLPVKIAFEKFDLQFESSYIPANPIDQLILSLRSVIKGIKAEVWWHLEPQGYYFEFEKFSEEYKISILSANSINSDKKKVFEQNGNFKSLILPFYRAIKRFVDQLFEHQNWPKTDKLEIEKLNKLIECNKN